jgi:hypothetical protein
MKDVTNKYGFRLRVFSIDFILGFEYFFFNAAVRIVTSKAPNTYDKD